MEDTMTAEGTDDAAGPATRPADDSLWLDGTLHADMATPSGRIAQPVILIYDAWSQTATKGIGRIAARSTVSNATAAGTEKRIPEKVLEMDIAA